MRKKIMSAALATAMALSVTACTSNPADKTTAAPAETKAEAAETTAAAAEEKKEAADGELITQMMQVLLTLRQNARSAKDFATADFLRDACKTEGLVIEDTPQGMSWKWAGEAAESADGIMQAIIAVRKAARANKNYALADAIRDGLGQAGLILEDTPQGTSWKKA